MQYGTETGDVLRAAMADFRGHLDKRDWETSSAATMQHLWVTDCASVETAHMRPVAAKLADKRLQIEVAGLRQSLWRTSGSRADDPMVCDDIPKKEDRTDLVIWVDTDVMIADPLTKQMEPEKLVHTMKTGIWDQTQPIESLAKKRIKQEQRRSKDKRIQKEEELRIASGHSDKYEVSFWQKQAEHNDTED